MPAKMNIDDVYITQLYEDGKSTIEISNELGVSNATIIRRIRLHRGSLRTPKEAANLREALGRRPILRYWEGKKQPKEMVAKRTAKTTGANNGRYKNGSQSRLYRNVITKEKCIECGTKDNLVIHHKDFDHYNNDINNLSVLCISCHASLHTTARWQREKCEVNTPISNAPIGWRKKIA